MDTTPEIYDDEEIPWTEEKDKAFLEGFFSNSDEEPEILVLDKTKKENELPNIQKFFDPMARLRSRQKAKKEEKYENKILKEENNSNYGFEKFEVDIPEVDEEKIYIDALRKGHRPQYSNVKRNAVDAFDKVTSFSDVVETADRQINSYSNPTKVYDVNGKKVKFNAKGKYGIGVLPDGTVVCGENTTPQQIEEFYKWSLKKDNSEKDYRILDITEFLNDFMINRAKQYDYINTAPFIEKYLTFYNTVKKGSTGDLKSYPEIKKHDYFLYNGEIVQYDDLGNIAYGHLGKHFGIPDILLRAGAGYAQIKDNKEINLPWINSLFDDPRDAERNKQGRDMYKQVGLDLDKLTK